MIPRTIHQIWIGPRPLPEVYRRYRQTWAEQHPGWNFYYWDNRAVRELQVSRSGLLDQVRTESERSDLLRYEILYRFGGVYVDADFECLRSISKLAEPHTFFLACDKTPQYLNTGLLGVVPRHPFLAAVLASLPGHLAQCQSRDVTAANSTTGTWFFGRLVKRCKPHLHVFPAHVFYPYLWDELHRRNEDFHVTSPDSYAVHHWGLSWRGTAAPVPVAG